MQKETNKNDMSSVIRTNKKAFGIIMTIFLFIEGAFMYPLVFAPLPGILALNQYLLYATTLFMSYYVGIYFNIIYTGTRKEVAIKVFRRSFINILVGFIFWVCLEFGESTFMKIFKLTNIIIYFAVFPGLITIVTLLLNVKGGKQYAHRQ